MTDDLAYLGRNLDGRTKKAVEDFELEVSRVMRQAAGAGALNSSRTFIEFWNAGVGVGNFAQSAFIQNHQPLIDEINKVLASDEFTALKPAEQEGVRDIADIVKAEAEKPEPDVGKLKRWGGRLVDLTADVGLKVVS